MPKNKGGDAKGGAKGAKGKGGEVKETTGKQNGQKVKIRHVLW